MNRTLLVAALFAVALSACSKKEEAIAALPAPAVAPSLPSAGENNTEAAKPADAAAPAAIPAAPAPTAENKPAN